MFAYELRAVVQLQYWPGLQSVSVNRICTPGLRCQIVNGNHLTSLTMDGAAEPRLSK